MVVLSDVGLCIGCAARASSQKLVSHGLHIKKWPHGHDTEKYDSSCCHCCPCDSHGIIVTGFQSVLQIFERNLFHGEQVQLLEGPQLSGLTWICYSGHARVNSNEKVGKLAGTPVIQGTPRMDNEEIARARLDRIHLEDDIWLNDSNHIKRMIELRKVRKVDVFFQTTWFSARYPQPVCDLLHQQALTSRGVGTEGRTRIGMFEV